MNLKYDSDEQIIYVMKADGSKEVLEAEFPSEPVTSPDKTKAVYIAPLEWERLGSLYLYDLLTGENKELIKPDDKHHIPKKVIWLDNHNLAVIIGFGYGTVAIGGNVFVYNLDTEQKKPLTEYDQRTQVTNIVFKDGVLELEGIRYIDDTFNEFERFEEKIKLSHADGEVQIAT
ncbi:DUF4652 domain-containing protein [Geobacillus thermodenitrificans]|uniref:DUF4652 domain-containing protein n=1 Tax=Geobacillus thermodenitrificans TaxID=33940 RepID=UPI003D1FAC46